MNVVAKDKLSFFRLHSPPVSELYCNFYPTHMWPICMSWYMLCCVFGCLSHVTIASKWLNALELVFDTEATSVYPIVLLRNLDTAFGECVTFCNLPTYSEQLIFFPQHFHHCKCCQLSLTTTPLSHWALFFVCNTSAMTQGIVWQLSLLIMLYCSSGDRGQCLDCRNLK